MLPRRVQAEMLDGLAATDPVAERSRRDLRRVHQVMGTPRPARAHVAAARDPQPAGRCASSNSVPATAA